MLFGLSALCEQPSKSISPVTSHCQPFVRTFPKPNPTQPTASELMPHRCILDGFKTPGKLVCYAPLSGLNASFLCHFAVIAHRPSLLLFTPLTNRLRTAHPAEGPSWSVIHYLRVFLLLFHCLVCFCLSCFPLMNFLLYFATYPRAWRRLRLGCCFIFKLLNFIGVSLFMGHHRQKHYISISTCLSTSHPLFIWCFPWLVYFQLQPILGWFCFFCFLFGTTGETLNSRKPLPMPFPFLFLIYFYVLWKFQPSSSYFLFLFPVN